MSVKPNQPTGHGFSIEGQITRTQADEQPDALPLSVYAFDRSGALLGSGDVTEKGAYSVALGLSQPADINVLVGPAGMPEQIRNSSAYRTSFTAADLKAADGRLKYSVALPPEIWRPWWPVRICVSGHVRKVHSHDGATGVCPVPYAKVEIFDVDREFCLWPPLRKWWNLLLDRPVIRLPDLLTDPPWPPLPFPGPDPVPDLKVNPILRGDIGRSPLSRVALNPQPLPPGGSPDRLSTAAGLIGLNPQPEPPISAIQANFTRVGEARLIDSSIAARLDNLTITSKRPPWLVFPRCYYSKVEVCETTTDCNGYFNCCFKWWPFQFRSGRLRFDLRPDIIIRVTQVIDGVSTVIYMDPYTSTRWNVTNCHIDLLLDDEDVVCGPGCNGDPRPEGTAAFYTRVGNDYVYDIDQTAGTYHGGGFSNVAYGSTLNLQAVLGKGLTEAATPYYYRLSVAPGASPPAAAFRPITTPLADTRVNKATFVSESHSLGPQVVAGQPALYEIRNTRDYYWYWPDLIGSWATPADVPDEGLYTVRLEVFNNVGAKLTSAAVDYRDGTVAPPGPLPPMPDHCDLILQIDNVAPDITLTVPAAGTECGVVPFAAVPFAINTSVTQENGRLYAWNLSYVKGLATAETWMDGESSPAGLSPLPRNDSNSSAPFTAGITTTCAFSLVVDAWSHIRNGYGFIGYSRLIKPVAVERCPASAVVA